MYEEEVESSNLEIVGYGQPHGPLPSCARKATTTAKKPTRPTTASAKRVNLLKLWVYLVY